MTGHTRPRHYWESLPWTMAGNSWDSFVQGTAYDTLPHALGCVRFAALKTQWVKVYKEVHKVRGANFFVGFSHMVDDGCGCIKEQRVVGRLILICIGSFVFLLVYFVTNLGQSCLWLGVHFVNLLIGVNLQCA